MRKQVKSFALSNMLGDIKTKCNEFMENTSIHGVPNIKISTSRLSRAFWTCICCLALTMFIVMLTLNARQYLSYPSAINIVEDSTGFVPPLISFCGHEHISGLFVQSLINVFEEGRINNNNINNTHFECKMDHQNTEPEIGMLYYIIETLEEWIKQMEVMYNDDDANNTSMIEFIGREFIFAQLSPNIIDKITPEPNELIISCVNDKKSCNLDNFVTEFYDPFFYKCYTCDPKESEPDGSFLAGIKHGVTFVLMSGSGLVAEAQELLPGYTSHIRGTGGTDGVTFMLHPRGTHPDPLVDGIDVPSGTSVILGITSKDVLRLEPPYGNCGQQFHLELLPTEMQRNDDSFEKSDREAGDDAAKKYITSQCKQDCHQNQNVIDCDCLDVSLMQPKTEWTNKGLCQFLDFSSGGVNLSDCCSKMNTDKDCQNVMMRVFEKIKCVKSVRKSYPSWHLECECPPACNETQYQTSYSMSSWPAKGPELNFAYQTIVRNAVLPFLKEIDTTEAGQFYNYYGNESNKDEIMSNFVKVTLYYQSLSVTKTIQIKVYSIVDILCDIGGLMGLWLGISVISLFELFLFVFSVAGRVAKELAKGIDHSRNAVKRCADDENPINHNW